jgi:hypothetical protein
MRADAFNSISETPTSTTNPTYQNSSRPRRTSAIQGEQTRRNADIISARLDRLLEKDMGTSIGFYSITKSGSTRKEYTGK